MAQSIPVPGQPGRMLIPGTNTLVEQDRIEPFSYRFEVNQFGPVSANSSSGSYPWGWYNRIPSMFEWIIDELWVEPDEAFLRCKRELLPLSILSDEKLSFMIGNGSSFKFEATLIELMDHYHRTFNVAQAEGAKSAHHLSRLTAQIRDTDDLRIRLVSGDSGKCLDKVTATVRISGMQKRPLST